MNKSIKALAKFSSAKLDKHLALTRAQIVIAARTKNDVALARLQQREVEIIQAIILKNF